MGPDNAVAGAAIISLQASSFGPEAQGPKLHNRWSWPKFRVRVERKSRVQGISKWLITTSRRERNKIWRRKKREKEKKYDLLIF